MVGVSYIQKMRTRPSSGCDFNLHFHTVMGEGVWFEFENEGEKIRFYSKAPSETKLGAILENISTRVTRFLRR